MEKWTAVLTILEVAASMGSLSASKRRVFTPKVVWTSMPSNVADVQVMVTIISATDRTTTRNHRTRISQAVRLGRVPRGSAGNRRPACVYQSVRPAGFFASTSNSRMTSSVGRTAPQRCAMFVSAPSWRSLA